MTILEILDITEAIRAALRGEHTFTDATRVDAQQTVRHMVEDRIYVGRKPQTVKGGFILVSVSDVDREYFLGGELDSAQTLVEIACHHDNRRKMMITWEGVRQMLTSLKTTISTQDGNIYIGGCTLESEGEPPPEEPIDGSDEFTYFYNGFFRITHTIKVPSGLS